MRSSFTSRIAGNLLATAVLCAIESGALAATNIWTGGGVNNFWTTAANWSNSVAPVAGADLVFTVGTTRQVNSNNFPAGTTFNSITFSDSNYVLRGSNLVLAAGIIATHPSGINEVRLPIQLSANQTFTNTGGGSVYFLLQTIDLNGHDLTFGIGGGDIQVGLSTITGDGAVIKTGPASLNMGAVGFSNSYTGVTEVRQGTLLVQSGSALGTTAGNTTVFAGATLNPGSTFTNPEPLVLQGTFSIGGFSFGTNHWTGPVTLLATNVSIVANSSARADLDGPVSGTGGLNKSGLGTLALNATNTYTGSTTNSSGNLLINGYQPQSPIFLNGGTVSGTGTVGTITAAGFSAKTLAPGGSTGTLACSNVTLSSSTTFSVELNGPSPGSGYDQLDVHGTVTLNSAVLNASLGFTPSGGENFIIINNDGSDAVAGTFSGLVEGAVLTLGTNQLRISYVGGTGNDVVLSPVNQSSQLTAIAALANGLKQIQGVGVSNVTYTIQAATNLNPIIVWSSLGPAVANSNGVFTFIDTNAPLFPIRFYRAVSP